MFAKVEMVPVLALLLLASCACSGAVLPRSLSFAASSNSWNRDGDHASPFRTMSNNAPFQMSPADVAYIQSRYGSDGRSQTVHDRIPRFGYSNDLSAVVVQMKGNNGGSSGFSGDLKSYGIGVAILFGIGLIIAFLTLFCAIIYSCCLCCKCCCCGKGLLPERLKERTLCPMITLVVAGVCASAFGILGIVYNEKLTNDIGGSNSGIVGTAIGTLGVGSDFLSNLTVPVQQVQTALPTVVNNINSIIQSTGNLLQTGVPTLTGLILNESNYISNPPVNFTINNATYVCSYCVDAASQISSTVSQISSSSSGTIGQMQSVLNQASTQVTAKQSDIQSQLNSVLDTISSNRQTLLNNEYQFQWYTRDVESRDNQRRIGTLILLLLPASSLILIVIGLVVRKALPFKIVVWFSFLMVFLTALIFAITLPFSALIADSCVFLDGYDPNITQYDLVTGDGARVAVSCLTNEWLLGPDVLNVSSQLNFTSYLNFDQYPEIYTPASQYLNFSQLDSFSLQIFNLDTTTFGYDPAVANGLLADLNSLTSPDVYTRTNISSSSPDPNHYGSLSNSNKTRLTGDRDALVQYISVENQLTTFLTALKANVSNITSYANYLRSALTNAQNQVINLQGLLQPLLTPAQNLENMAYCGFLGDQYRNIKLLYCNNIMAEVSYLCLSVFIITVMGIFMIIFGAHMANLESLNADIQKNMEENPDHDGPESNKLPAIAMDGSSPQGAGYGYGGAPYQAQSQPVTHGRSFREYMSSGFSGASAPVAPPPYQPQPQPQYEPHPPPEPSDRPSQLAVNDLSPPAQRLSAAAVSAPQSQPSGEDYTQ